MIKKTNLHTEPIKVALVDDELHCLDNLSELIGQNPGFINISECNNPSDAEECLLNLKPDLIFLDIHMPGMSGFELLKALNNRGYHPWVIFVTAFDSYAIEAIKNAAFDYLLKPVTENELEKTLERFLQAFSKRNEKPDYKSLMEALDVNKKIRMNNSGGFILFNPDDIIYIEADWNYSRIFTNFDKSELITQNLGSIEDLLPRHSFIRINRSVIINLKYLYGVKRISRKCILCKDGNAYEFSIPIGRIRDLEKMLV
jgi:two-component system, LytTR family, response regulator